MWCFFAGVGYDRTIIRASSLSNNRNPYMHGTKLLLRVTEGKSACVLGSCVGSALRSLRTLPISFTSLSVLQLPAALVSAPEPPSSVFKKEPEG